MSRKKLSDLENVIDKSRRRFHEIGAALKTIRDEKLYRIVLFDTFEAYVRQRWEMGSSQAYRLIEASTVMDNLSPIGETLPENESQARILASLPAAKQRQIWSDFLQSDNELTALNLKKFIEVNRREKNNKQEDLSGLISVHYKTKVLEMMEQINLAKNDNWQTTSRQAALLWNSVMKEKIMSKS